jgi:hypothetical protein
MCHTQEQTVVLIRLCKWCVVNEITQTRNIHTQARIFACCCVCGGPHTHIYSRTQPAGAPVSAARGRQVLKWCPIHEYTVFGQTSTRVVSTLLSTNNVRCIQLNSRVCRCRAKTRRSKLIKHIMWVIVNAINAYVLAYWESASVRYCPTTCRLPIYTYAGNERTFLIFV